MRLVLLVTLLLLPFLSDPALALTDAQKCSSFKWKVAGGHAECLLKEDAKAIKTGKEPDYSSCERKLTIKYTRAELKWACDVEGEVANVSNLLNTCTEGVRNTTTSNALSVVGVSPGWTCTGPAPDNCEPICGDSLTVGTEFCDDGNTTGSDGCSADCLSGCGDSVFEPAEGEECDDGNSATDDGCTPDCIVESCGDGVRQASEACDDFNNDDGDGCSADCQSDETCGNGVVDAVTGEECDDGGVDDGDGCSAVCESEATCANGSVWEEHGDGTVTQCSTGLIWEMKTGTVDGGIACVDIETCPDPHDVNNVYSWSLAYGAAFNGTARTLFIDILNDVSGGGANCFAGSCDWRLPTIEELSGRSDFGVPTGGIVDLATGVCAGEEEGCSSIPGPTYPGTYWSSTIYNENSMWAVTFHDDNNDVHVHYSLDHVRAVRDPS